MNWLSGLPGCTPHEKVRRSRASRRGEKSQVRHDHMMRHTRSMECAKMDTGVWRFCVWERCVR